MLTFKNDKERIAFLEDYRNQDNGWWLWKKDNDLNRKWWRFDLTDCSFIVEEQLQTIRWPDVHEKYCVVHWYVIDNYEAPFADGQASRTQALARLKEAEKK